MGMFLPQPILYPNSQAEKSFVSWKSIISITISLAEITAASLTDIGD